ncbi:hypothetical protein QVD17_29645 [Tagetes erecta]|uniref:Uncharacterized protein n=1 Tax=Tagetes erecta TaxID=13708 RepID=A0AAD8K1A9_TARER|nr:hypothetical protein QVD17_29645 [Tagetes erecta]
MTCILLCPFHFLKLKPKTKINNFHCNFKSLFALISIFNSSNILAALIEPSPNSNLFFPANDSYLTPATRHCKNRS